MKNFKNFTNPKQRAILKKLFSILYSIIQYIIQLFNEGILFHIETSPLIYCANQWTGFYMIGTSIMKELKHFPALALTMLQHDLVAGLA